MSLVIALLLTVAGTGPAADPLAAAGRLTEAASPLFLEANRPGAFAHLSPVAADDDLIASASIEACSGGVLCEGTDTLYATSGTTLAESSVQAPTACAWQSCRVTQSSCYGKVCSVSNSFCTSPGSPCSTSTAPCSGGTTNLCSTRSTPCSGGTAGRCTTYPGTATPAPSVAVVVVGE